MPKGPQPGQRSSQTKKKSLGDKAVLVPLGDPDDDLSEAAKGIWTQLVASLPADSLPESKRALVRIYCESYVEMRALAPKVREYALNTDLMPDEKVQFVFKRFELARRSVNLSLRNLGIIGDGRSTKPAGGSGNGPKLNPFADVDE